MLDAELRGWAERELKAQPDAPSPTLALLSALEGMLGVLQDHPEDLMNRFREGPGSEGWKACETLFSRILRNGVIAGDFRRDLDADVMGRSLAAMVYGNAAHAHLTQQPLATESLATELYRALIAGLAAPPQPLKKE
jgi:hypothetical protein